MRILILILALLTVGCGNTASYDQEVAVRDVQQPDVVILQRKGSSGNVDGITIWGVGTIDGEAKVSLMLNGEPYKIENLRGRIALTWRGDWYSDTAEIRYEPKSVSSGNVLFKVTFHTL